ncbi:MAG TPA: RelA/SpoT domain-containing protein [Bryobacteraceae bacterium]|nr:RelA/SpoT domain-containing protein [Bryobacteraceae bacterium]
MEKQSFLDRYNFTAEDFQQADLDWALLDRIYEHHRTAVSELQTTATYISERLQLVPAVHSIKVRVKDAEHLVAKIIRKRIERPDLIVDLASYDEHITDRIGIRALHLFKDEWKPIHEFVTNTWDLQETPIAYFRAGDEEAVLRSFTDAGFNVQQHKLGYRSIHYLIRLQPTKCKQYAELQVRTIFEEGWSEIDHRVRYPRQSDNPYLSGILNIFNRLAGSADEVGTFVKALSQYTHEQAKSALAKETEIRGKEDELRKAVSLLEISQEEKTNLQRQIAELRSSSYPAIGTVVITSSDSPFQTSMGGSVRMGQIANLLSLGPFPPSP